jgi:hypothetical protein
VQLLVRKTLILSRCTVLKKKKDLCECNTRQVHYILIETKAVVSIRYKHWLVKESLDCEGRKVNL